MGPREWPSIAAGGPPRAVALYLGHLAADGKAMATIALARAAISHAHAAAGTAKGDNPARHPVVAQMIKGWRNQAPAQKQAGALTTQALTRIRETVRLPRRGRGGHMETPAAARARAAVHLAIIGVLTDGGLRRSEGAALTWGDVDYEDGTARITIHRGRTSPHQLLWRSRKTPPAPCAKSSRTELTRHTGIRPDRGDAGRPGAGCGQGRQSGRRVYRRQRPDRHGAPDGGGEGAQRGDATPGPVEARRHGGPLYAGRGRWRGPQVAELTYPLQASDSP